MIRRDDVDVEVWWSDSDELSEKAGIRLTHKTTGLTAESSQHMTQIENYNAALAELERRVADVLP